MTVQTFLSTFRGVPFLSESTTTEGGRKTVSHEYPDQKERFVEDLGGKMKKFSIRAVITGSDSTEYYFKKLAFITALETKGWGILTHPYFGIVTVSCISYSLAEENTRIGEARFDLNFEETANNIFPKFFNESLSGLNDLANTIIGMAGAALITGTVSNSRNIRSTALKLTSLSSLIKSSLPAAAPVPSVIDKTQSNYLNDSLNNFDSNIYQYAQNSTLLSEAVLNLLSDYTSTANTSEYAFSINKELFNYGMDDKNEYSDAYYLRLRKINRRTLNDCIYLIALCKMYIAAIEINYQDNLQLQNYIFQLETLYLRLTNNSILDSDTLAQLQNLRTRTNIYLSKLIINQVVTININEQPLTNLLYNYYEDFENEDEIIALNNIINPSIMKGNVKIVVMPQ